MRVRLPMGRARRWTIIICLWPLSLFYCGMIYTQQTKFGVIISSHRETIENEFEKQIIWNEKSSPRHQNEKKVSPSQQQQQQQQQQHKQQLDNLLSKYNLTMSNKQPTAIKKITIPDINRSIAFLHIGKTGGSTISMHLRNGCRDLNIDPCLHRRKDGANWTPNETVASRRIEAYYHLEDIPPERLLLRNNNRRNHQDHHFTSIVTVVRNPISRFLSAFAYEHPTNSIVTNVIYSTNEDKEKYTCFPSISHLVKAAVGRAPIPWVKSHAQRVREKNRKRNEYHGARRRNRRQHQPQQRSLEKKIPLIDCTELAELAFGLNESWPIVNTSHPWVNHMTFDYRQYYRSMPLDKELIVMRHEHLWDDWVAINHLLSDNDGNDAYRNWPIVPPFHDIQRNKSSAYRMNSKWNVQTSLEQSWLCRLLHDEIRTYLIIMMRAVNLDDDDLWKAANDVGKICDSDQNHYFPAGANASSTKLS